MLIKLKKLLYWLTTPFRSSTKSKEAVFTADFTEDGLKLICLICNQREFNRGDYYSVESGYPKVNWAGEQLIDNFLKRHSHAAPTKGKWTEGNAS